MMSNTKHVLVVDDDRITLAMLQHYLGSIGIPTLMASDGESALQFLREQAEDIGVVFLDLAMPQMNGYEVCEAIRTNLGLSDLPVYAITARDDPKVHARAMEAGIDGIISKPFEPRYLKLLLNNLKVLP